MLAHSKGTTITPAASLALEAAAAGGSRGRGVGNDGGGLFASQVRVVVFRQIPPPCFKPICDYTSHSKEVHYIHHK